MKKLLFISIAAAAFCGASAFAADMPTKGPVYRAAPMFNWTGFYVGLHGGYGRAEADVTGDVTPIFNSTLEPRGAFFGAQAGYNWQVAPNWVWGIEGDIAYASLDQNTVVPVALFNDHTKIDRLASIRARAGYAWDRSLLYVTGGWGWAKGNNTISVPGVADSNKLSLSGWVLGAGYEMAIANNWSVKVEYLYYDFGDKSFAAPNLAPGIIFTADANIQTIKAGVNYRFGSY